MCAIDFFYNVA